MLWHLQIDPAPGRMDIEGRRIAAEAEELGLPGPWRIGAGRGFLIEGDATREELIRAAETILADRVVETFTLRPSNQPVRLTADLAALRAIVDEAAIEFSRSERSTHPMRGAGDILADLLERVAGLWVHSSQLAA